MAQFPLCTPRLSMQHSSKIHFMCQCDGDIWINLSMVMYEDSLHCYLRTFTRDQTWDQGHLRQEMVFVLSVTNGCCGWWNNIFLILTAIKIKWTQSNHNKIINDIIKSWRFEYSLQQILFLQLHYIAHTTCTHTHIALHYTTPHGNTSYALH